MLRKSKDEKYLAHIRRHRMRKIGAACTQHRECKSILRSVAWERGSGVCGICLGAVFEKKWHLDHIIPLSRGGQDCYANLQVAHSLCNMRKGTMTMEEYLA